MSNDRNRQATGTVRAIVGDFDVLCEPAAGWPDGAPGPDGAPYPANAVGAHLNVDQVVSPGNAAAQIVFDAEDYDEDGRYNAGSGVYTNTGDAALHYINTSVLPLSTGLQGTIVLNILVNGAAVASGTYHWTDEAGLTNAEAMRLNTTVNVPAGQTVTVEVTSSDAADFTVSGGTATFLDVYTVRTAP